MIRPAPLRLRRPPGAFTVPELLLVTAMIAILLVMAFPAFQGTATQSRQARCMANLRSWGQLIGAYLTEHNGVFPQAFIPQEGGGNISWNHFNAPLVRMYGAGTLRAWRQGEEINGCPEHTNAPYGNGNYSLRYYSYAINGHLTHDGLLNPKRRLAAVMQPSRVILLADASEEGLPVCVFAGYKFNNYLYQTALGKPHRGRTLALFVDQHIESLGAVTPELVSP